jgi:signal transduction histidine kinase
VTRRLLLSYLTITLIVLLLLEIPLGLFYAQRERERLAADVEHDATVIATLYEDDLEVGAPLDPTPADTYEDRTGARVVVVDADGIARVDTGGDVPRDFSTRPEIAAALEGERAAGTRRSDTLGTDLLYVAVPVASGGTVHGALRVTLDIADVNERIRSFWLALVAIAAVVLAAVAMIGWVIARSVTRPLRALTESAERFASGDLAVTPTATGGPPEIRALDDTLTTMALQLDGLLSSQRAFVADASHQLRTPLTALRLRLENLQGRVAEDPSDRAVGAEIERAIDETGRLTELVTSLLQLARTDDRPDTRAEDVVELIRDRVDTWTAVAEERGVALVGPDRGEGPGEGSGGRVLVRVVPGAVEQILDNVLDNALLVSDVGSTVDVRLATSPDRVALCVVDRGPGLSDADKRDAMRRFWRGDTTRPGTGLGLAIVDALATASGGSAVLSDTDGGGLTVTVTLLRATD